MRKDAGYKRNSLACYYIADSQNIWRNRNVEPEQFPAFNEADIDEHVHSY